MPKSKKTSKSNKVTKKVALKKTSPTKTKSPNLSAKISLNTTPKKILAALVIFVLLAGAYVLLGKFGPTLGLKSAWGPLELPKKYSVKTFTAADNELIVTPKGGTAVAGRTSDQAIGDRNKTVWAIGPIWAPGKRTEGEAQVNIRYSMKASESRTFRVCGYFKTAGYLTVSFFDKGLSHPSTTSWVHWGRAYNQSAPYGYTQYCQSRKIYGTNINQNGIQNGNAFIKLDFVDVYTKAQAYLWKVTVEQL